MSQSPTLVLRALGALLTYPTGELRDALPEIAEALRAASLLQARERDPVLGLVELLADADPLWAEENHGETFDRGRATSLHLFEHVHGDTRARGDAMIELKKLYEDAGFALTANELPDYLPVVLEYLSCRELPEAEAMLGDCAHILRSVGEALAQRGSPYAAVFEALLRIAGQAGLDREAAARRAREAEDLDADWAEQPAFGPQDRAGACATPQDRRT